MALGCFLDLLTLALQYYYTSQQIGIDVFNLHI